MIFDKLTRLLADAPTVVRECRRCGASLDTDADRCPECGSGESARFEIS
ncbi:hypothetical protein [Halostella litorea]|nr:hypothetical protein [Halostella litorea]